MQVPEIDIDEAKKALDAKAAIFIDIRDPHSFSAAHIPGALTVDDRTVGKFVEETDKATPIIVYCYHGHSSLGGAAYFLHEGFKDVKSMSGGFAAWRSVHPIEKG